MEKTRVCSRSILIFVRNVEALLKVIAQMKSKDLVIYILLSRLAIAHGLLKEGLRWFEEMKSTLGISPEHNWDVVLHVLELHYLYATEKQFNAFVDQILPSLLDELKQASSEDLAAKTHLSLGTLAPRILRLTSTKASSNRLLKLIEVLNSHDIAYPAYIKQSIKSLFRRQMIDEAREQIKYAEVRLFEKLKFSEK
jgi:hypothetical protein